jgi:hypothetical protein
MKIAMTIEARDCSVGLIELADARQVEGTRRKAKGAYKSNAVSAQATFGDAV